MAAYYDPWRSYSPLPLTFDQRLLVKPLFDDTPERSEPMGEIVIGKPDEEKPKTHFWLDTDGAGGVRLKMRTGPSGYAYSVLSVTKGGVVNLHGSLGGSGLKQDGGGMGYPKVEKA